MDGAGAGAGGAVDAYAERAAGVGGVGASAGEVGAEAALTGWPQPCQRLLPVKDRAESTSLGASQLWMLAAATMGCPFVERIHTEPRKFVNCSGP